MMNCFVVILVLLLFSYLAVFLWCWSLSEGIKTILIFIFEDFAFPLGEKFNFDGVCFGIFLDFFCSLFSG